MEKRTTWSRVKEAVGWTALTGALGGMVMLIMSTFIDAPTSLRDYEGRRPKVFEVVFMHKQLEQANALRIKENTEKAWALQRQVKLDSVAKVQAHNDSIKAVMAKKHMKPKAKATQPSPLRTIKH